MDGVIVADKPAGWTSHDVVNRVRRLANTKKVGHLGTLDPLATGVLPLVVGRATRLAQFFLRTDKTYDATIEFGYSTTTYDREGEPTSEPVEVRLDRAVLERELEALRGRIQQTPPPVSAKKIQGTPAYKLVRKNIEVKLEPVEVEIFSIEVVTVEQRRLRIVVHCGGGTYVRSIAHDLGQRLGCGAHLSELRRTASSGFHLPISRTLEDLADLAQQGRIQDALIPAPELLPEFPAERVDEATVNFIRQGRDFRVSPFRMQPDARYVKAIGPEGSLIAIGEVRLPHVYHPILVL